MQTALAQGQIKTGKRRSPLREDWDCIRAAQHMMANFGARAAAVATQRAGNAGEAGIIWERVAQMIRALEERRPGAPVSAHA